MAGCCDDERDLPAAFCWPHVPNFMQRPDPAFVFRRLIK
jgi:hypothetical protein